MTRLYGKGTIKEIVRGKKYHLCLSAGRDPLSGRMLSSKEAIPANAIALRADGKPRSPLLKYGDATAAQKRRIAHWQAPVRYLKKQETFLGTKRQAELRIEEMRRELEQGTAIGADRLTVADWVERYLANRESAAKVRPATLAHDRGMAKHIVAGLGSVLVVDLTPVMVNSFYTLLRDKGTGDTTVSQCHKLLKAVMRDAVNNDIIARNPVDRADAPRRPKPKRNALSIGEAARLSEVCSSGTPSANKVAVYLGLALGARLGEVLGLEWRHVDIDGERPFVHIVQQYTTFGEIAPTKTDHADTPIGRIVPIDASTVSMLRAWRVEQRSLLNAIGKEQSPSTPVVTNRRGSFSNHYNFESWFRGFCAGNGFGRFSDEEGRPIVELTIGDDAGPYEDCRILWRDGSGWPCDENGRRYSRSYRRPKVVRHYSGLVFHELRHSNFTIRLANGTDITTCQYLGGWSSPEILMKTYAHPVAENIWSSAGFMDGLASGAPARRVR